MPFHRRKNTGSVGAGGGGQAPAASVSARIVVGVERGVGAEDDVPGAGAVVVAAAPRGRTGQAGVDDHRALAVIGTVPVPAHVASKRPRPTRPPLNCDHLKRAGPARRVGDLDAVEVVLEAGVAAAGDDRAVAADGDASARA